MCGIDQCPVEISPTVPEKISTSPLKTGLENTTTLIRCRAHKFFVHFAVTQVCFLLAKLLGIVGLEHVLVESCLEREGQSHGKSDCYGNS